MSSRMSSRLSIQSKRKLIALQSAGKREQYSSLYKDVALNKVKIQRDSNWLKEKLVKLEQENPILKENKISQSNFYMYGGGLLKLGQGNLIHQYLYANLVEMVEQKDLDEFRYR